MSEQTVFHPVQTHPPLNHAPEAVTRRAYEVYCALHGPQEALMDLAGRNCRGGFGQRELMAFLYARSFPREQWRERFEEGLEERPR